MAIKRINDVNAGVRRPFRLSDIQDLYDGLNQALALGTNTVPRILCGFDDNGNGTLSAGVVAWKGALYFHADTTGNKITIGANVYAREIASSDLRFFADGTEQVFSYDRVAGVTASGGTLIGAFTLANVSTWRMGFIADGSITSAKLASLAVTSGKIDSNAVTSGKLSTGAVTTAKVADGAITAIKMAAGAITAKALDMSLAACIPHPSITVRPPISVTSINLSDLMVYDSANGVWQCKPIEVSFFTNAVFTINCEDIPAATLATYPSFIPLCVNWSSDPEGTLTVVIRGTMGVESDLGWGATTFIREVMQPFQGGRFVGSVAKTASGYMPISLVAGDTSH